MINVVTSFIQGPDLLTAMVRVWLNVKSTIRIVWTHLQTWVTFQRKSRFHQRHRRVRTHWRRWIINIWKYIVSCIYVISSMVFTLCVSSMLRPSNIVGICQLGTAKSSVSVLHWIFGILFIWIIMHRGFVDLAVVTDWARTLFPQETSHWFIVRDEWFWLATRIGRR